MIVKIDPKKMNCNTSEIKYLEFYRYGFPVWIDKHTYSVTKPGYNLPAITICAREI